MDGDLRVSPIADICASSEEHCFTAWQEFRPGVADLPFLEPGQRPWGTSRVRHLQDRSASGLSECDGTLIAPTSPDRCIDIADNQRCSSIYRDLLKLSTSKKSHPLAVGREERLEGTLRVRNRPGLR